MRRMLCVVLVAAAAGMMGCAEQQDGASYVKIVPSIRTRVSGMFFEAGDRIGVSITRGAEVYATNRPMTYDGEAFAAPDMLWYNDLNQKSTLTAYYPYSEQGVPAEFTISADQQLGSASSDLLVAVRKDATPSAEPVGMVFYHVMSQLSVLISNHSSGKVTGVAIEGLSPVAKVDFSEPSAIARAGAASAVQTCCVTPDVCYRAVLVPQRAALTVCVVTSDGKEHRKTISDASLVSGKRYDLSVEVTNVDISLSLSGEISDWQDGGELDGGSDPSPDEALEYEGVKYSVVKLGDRVWMAENLRCMPAGVSVGSGVWYPASGSAAVAELGLLYNYAVATAGVQFTAGVPVQGICPVGWHIPDEGELTALIGDPKCTPDFFRTAGYWIKRPGSETYANVTKGYLMGANLAEGKCASLSYTTTTAAALTTVSAEYGLSVRCVKDVIN